MSNGSTGSPFIPNTVVDVKDGKTQCIVSNLSENSNFLFIGDITGNFSTVKDCEIFETNLTTNSYNSTNVSPHSTTQSISDQDQNQQEERPSQVDPDDLLTTLKFDLGEVKVGKQLTEDQKRKLIQILTDFKDVVAFDGHLGRTHLIEYQIEADRSQPVHVRPYRVSPQQRADIIKQAKSMLDAGIIEPSRSAWNSPIILVKKKDGSFRFVTDLRKVNELTKNGCLQYYYIFSKHFMAIS